MSKHYQEQEQVEISVEYRHQTKKAILVSDGDDEVWIPKSLISDWSDDDPEQGDVIVISIPEWFATKEGLV